MKLKVLIMSCLLIVLLICTLLPMVAFAEEDGKIIYVDVNNPAVGDGTKGNPYGTIKEAVEYIKNDETNEEKYIVFFLVYLCYFCSNSI